MRPAHLRVAPVRYRDEPEPSHPPAAAPEPASDTSRPVKRARQQEGAPSADDPNALFAEAGKAFKDNASTPASDEDEQAMDLLVRLWSPSSGSEHDNLMTHLGQPSVVTSPSTTSPPPDVDEPDGGATSAAAPPEPPRSMPSASRLAHLPVAHAWPLPPHLQPSAGARMPWPPPMPPYGPPPAGRSKYAPPPHLPPHLLHHPLRAPPAPYYHVDARAALRPPHQQRRHIERERAAAAAAAAGGGPSGHASAPSAAPLSGMQWHQLVEEDVSMPSSSSAPCSADDAHLDGGLLNGSVGPPASSYPAGPHLLDWTSRPQLLSRTPSASNAAGASVTTAGPGRPLRSSPLADQPHAHSNSPPECIATIVPQDEVPSGRVLPPSASFPLAPATSSPMIEPAPGAVSLSQGTHMVLGGPPQGPGMMSYGSPNMNGPVSFSMTLGGGSGRNLAERKEWSTEEDRQICKSVRKHGFKWRLVAADVPGRSDDAVRNRYNRVKDLPHLQPSDEELAAEQVEWATLDTKPAGRRQRKQSQPKAKSSSFKTDASGSAGSCSHSSDEDTKDKVERISWSRGEDETIVRSVNELGNKWAKIAERLHGRTEHAIRNRYARLMSLASRGNPIVLSSGRGCPIGIQLVPTGLG